MGTEEIYEFDEVTLLSPFAVGLPGERTFFLGIGDERSWVRIWVEKEHLQAMVQGIEQLLLLLSQEQIVFSEEIEDAPLADIAPSGLPSAELDIVQMTLGYEEGKATIDIMVEQSGAKEKDPGAVYCRVTLAQIKELRSRAKKVCAAGRPLCPICRDPINPSGHVCPAQN